MSSAPSAMQVHELISRFTRTTGLSEGIAQSHDLRKAHEDTSDQANLTQPGLGNIRSKAEES
ncbi:hypothetical protein VTO73DRAFT_2443, partial [Trametes versicolor]